MTYTKINKQILEELIACVGEKFVFADKETLENYNHDYTEDLKFNPEVVISHTRHKKFLLF